ncbi:MAG: hypothetical protein AAF098_17665, partial [Pseudomonadota bacterium]
ARSWSLARAIFIELAASVFARLVCSVATPGGGRTGEESPETDFVAGAGVRESHPLSAVTMQVEHTKKMMKKARIL